MSDQKLLKTIHDEIRKTPLLNSIMHPTADTDWHGKRITNISRSSKTNDAITRLELDELRKVVDDLKAQLRKNGIQVT